MDERRVSKTEARGSRLERVWVSARPPMRCTDALPDRLHPGDELGGREVAVDLALHEVLAQERARARTPNLAPVVTLLLNWHKLAGDRVQVEFRNAQPTGRYRRVLEPPDCTPVRADVGPPVSVVRSACRFSPASW